MIIKVGLDIKTKKEALREVAKVARLHKKIDDEALYLKALEEREEAFSTGCGSGIAIPHGKSRTVREHGIILFKLTKAIEWHAIDAELVDIVIALMIPEEQFDDDCLISLAKLARALVKQEFIDKLRCIEDPECMKQIMQEVMK